MTAIDDLVGDLDDFPVLEAPDGEEQAALSGLDEAVRASRSLRAVALRRQRIRAAADREVERIREWAASVDRPLATRAEYLEGLLVHYALAQRAAGGPKTLTTPYVRVETRQVVGKWTASEEALEWARRYRPELVQTVETIRLAEARRVLTDGGDGCVVDPVSGGVVPGMAAEPSRVAAKVTVDTDVSVGDAS